jgi:hypothetical protein
MFLSCYFRALLPHLPLSLGGRAQDSGRSEDEEGEAFERLS